MISAIEMTTIEVALTNNFRRMAQYKKNKHEKLERGRFDLKLGHFLWLLSFTHFHVGSQNEITFRIFTVFMCLTAVF